MMTNIETKNIIGNEIPRIYIKSIEYKSPIENKNKSINARIYYYILDSYENPQWVGEKFVSDNLKFIFKFNLENSKAQIYTKTIDVNFASIFQNYFNSKISNIPNSIVSGQKYYIFYNHVDFNLSHSNSFELNDVKCDISFDYWSYAGQLLTSEINTHKIISKNNINNQYLLYSNDDIFLDSSMQQGEYYYKKSNLRETLDRSDYNYLIKNYDLFDSSYILTNKEPSVKTKTSNPVNIIDLNSDNSYLLLQKITKTGYGNAKGIVVVDYDRLLNDKLSFYNYYSDSSIKELILENLKYDISITRNLIHENSKKISYLKTKNYTKDGTIEKNNITEIKNLDGTQGKNYKVFTFNDYSLNTREYGDYFYTIDFKIIDNIEKIIEENFVNKYEKSIKTLKSYQKDFNFAIIHPAYGFTDELFYQNIFLKKYSTAEYDLKDALKSMSLLCNIVFQEKFESLLFSLLNPLLCNITNINDVIQFLEDKLYPALIKFKSTILNKQLNQTPEKSYLFNFVLTNAENIVSNSKKEIGIDFISSVAVEAIKEYEKNNQGILSITNNGLSARITRELEKFNTKQNNIVSDDFILSTYSPTLIFVNNKKSYDLASRQLLLTDYSVIYRNFLGDYNNIKNSFGDYQNVFEQLESSGILIKSLAQKVKNTKSLSNKDIIYDINPSNETLKYITDTGILDFYNNLHSVKIKDGLKNCLTNSYQYKNASDSTKRMGNIVANIDSGSSAAVFFTNQLLGNMSIYTNFSNSSNSIDDFTSISSDIVGSTYRYRLCEINASVKNEVIPQSDYVVYNRIFLVSNSSALSTSNNSVLSSSVNNQIIDNFYTLAELPEYSRTYTENVPNKIEVANYVKKEKDDRTASLLKRL